MRSNSNDLEAGLMISLQTSASVVDEKQSNGDPKILCLYLKHRFSNPHLKQQVGFRW